MPGQREIVKYLLETEGFQLDETQPLLLVLEFFYVFSRFEYALKRARYAVERTNRRGHRWISIQWSGFAADIEEDFVTLEKQHKELQDAKQYLLSHPPRSQFLDEDKHLVWDHSIRYEEDTDLQWLTRLITTVRNNLFHGEKPGLLLSSERDRDVELVKSSLTILYACLGLKESVLSEFFRPNP